ncbi:MAG: hypothetical protein FE835_16665, partial [Gammaproteobacteria bacterium]|nr:hypothetical protein [Gammaproteobacteria bacterium]
MGIDPTAGLTVANSLLDVAIAAKSFSDGDYLSVSVDNHYADLVMLDSYMTDDEHHSARAVPHQSMFHKNQSDAGMFRVNAVTESQSSFLYIVEVGGRSHNCLINYKWAGSATGAVSLSIDESKQEGGFFKRLTVTEAASSAFRASVFATGGFLQLS